jgi:MFS family permease
MLQTISVNLVASFAGLFIKRLGAGDSLVSALNSLPGFFSLIAILVGIPFVSSIKNKKQVTALCYLTTRSFYLLMFFIPFLDKKYMALAFVILYGALNLPGSIGNYMWQSLLADVFRPSLRAKAISVRNILATIAGTVTTLAAGYLLYKLGSSSGSFLEFYQVVFMIAFVIGIGEAAALFLHKVDKHASHTEVLTRENPLSIKYIKGMLQHKPYVSFMLCVTFFNFAWQMAWPLFTTYEVDYLHTNELWSAGLAVLSGAFSAIGYVWWRKYSEKKGTGMALCLSAIFMGTSPILEAIATKLNHLPFFYCIMGIGVAGITFVVLNTLYEVSPNKNRTSYIAFYNLSYNLTLIIAPWMGTLLYNIVGIRPALAITGCLRLMAASTFFIRQKRLKKLCCTEELQS